MAKQKQKVAAGVRKRKPVKQTFSIDETVLSTLEDTWLELLNLAPKDKRRAVHRSAIVEAALVEALADFLDRKEKSKLFYAVLGDKGK